MKVERNYPQIGNVLYSTSSKARNYRIKIDNNGNVCVTISRLETLNQAEKFVLSKEDWIIKTKLKVSERHVKYCYGFTNCNTSVSLNIISQNKQKGIISFKVENATKMTIAFPEEIDINTTISQENIRKCIDKLTSVVANNYLRERINEISFRIGLQYQSVKITSAKTRWGSCSGRNTINLSKYLVLLPDELIDHVIIHELCHTVHKNHGAEFHKLLDFHCGGKEHAQAEELKKRHI